MRQTESDTTDTDTEDDPLGGLSDELAAETTPTPENEPDDTESTTPDDVQEKREPAQEQEQEDGPRPKRASEDLGARLTINLYQSLATRASAGYDQANALAKLAGPDDDTRGIEKNRHWYPLIFDLGLDAIEDMDDDELTEALLAYDDERDYDAGET